MSRPRVCAVDARDRVTIDLRDLGAALQARAKAWQVKAAVLARSAIDAMRREESVPDAIIADGGHPSTEPHRIIKVTVRLTVDRGLGMVRRNYESSVANGTLTAAQLDERVSLLSGSLDCDLVNEAVYEDFDLSGLQVVGSLTIAAARCSWPTKSASRESSTD